MIQIAAWTGVYGVSALLVLVNTALGSRSARWLLEKLFGVSRRRRLPRFASRSFLQRAEQRGWTQLPRSGRPSVAYFVDVFANYNDPLIAEAVVKVLHYNGFDVYVPKKQVGGGMAPFLQSRTIARNGRHRQLASCFLPRFFLGGYGHETRRTIPQGSRNRAQ